MELNKVIQEQTNKLIVEKLPELVEVKVTKMVDDILSDIFRSYSDTAKQIKEKIEEQLDVSLVQFELQDYNTMVSKAVASQLKKDIDLKPIKEMVRSIVGKTTEKQIKVSDLAERVKELAMNEEYGFESNYEGKISFHIEVNYKHKWTTINIDLEADKRPKECAIEILVSDRSGCIFSMRKSDFWQKSKEFSPADMVSISALENMIFSLYNNQVVIVIDDEYVDTEWCRD